MSLLRLIARLDIKGPNVVKGVQMEGLRVVGKPAALARKYAESGADELLYIDTVATLYGRNQLGGLLEQTCEEVFVPITVGGGIRSTQDIRSALLHGADKCAINTAALYRPELISDAVEKYGSQAIVVSIEAKRVNGGWEAYTDNGREKTGKDAIRWAHEAVELGAGELLITSIDQDGTKRGFDVDLIKAIAPHVSVPVTACGGAGCVEHIREVLREGKADAVAVASVLHYGKLTFEEIREAL
ncbi:MAG: imidazole glycerol phosphate synthase cyclase subunit [Candidatus Binatia bacterium]|nr:imidazole glycerol phosphate synthase cyclase subunit [Candidatus Binatia bacterium]